MTSSEWIKAVIKIIAYELDVLGVNGRWLAAFGLEPVFRRSKMFRMIQDRVLTLNRSNRIHPILLLDEAQYLSNSILQEIRLLTNFEIDSFNALTVLPNKVIVFDELCHSCGGCALVCPEKAIEEIPRPIGVTSAGRGSGAGFVEGRMNVGESQAPPLIKAVKEHSSSAEIVIVDAPPGTSCSVIESIADSQFVALVTEPTPFGLHDLKLAVSMLGLLHLPHGVIINRDEGDSAIITEYCDKAGVEILACIPFDRQISRKHTPGVIFCLTAALNTVTCY